MSIVTDIILHTNPLLIYFIVALILLLESSGIPIVNTTLLLFTGALASSGYVHLPLLAFSAIVGSVAGACLAYLIGRRGGRALLLRLTRMSRIDPAKVTIVERWFQKAGVWMVFLSRILPYVRPFACFPAGITRTKFSYFFFAALSGSSIWCIAVLFVGWFLGNRWRIAVDLAQQYTIPVLIGVLLLFLAYFLLTRLVQNYLRARYQSPALDEER